MEDLIQIFNVAKANLTEQWKSAGIKDVPTDKEVWGQMRATAVNNRETALEHDKGYAVVYEKRIAKIDKILSSLPQ